MNTVLEEFDYIQEARSELSEALIKKFGVQKLDIMNADGSVKTKGLWAMKKNAKGEWELGYLKRLHDWALLVTGTNVHTDGSLTFKDNGKGDASGTAFNGSEDKSISYNSIGAASSGHTHGIKYKDFTKTVTDTDTDSGWFMIDSADSALAKNKGFALKSIRTQEKAPAWLLGNYSAGIAFGGSDTKGVMSVSYDTPQIRFAGGNSTKPVWYITVTGTSGKSYNLANFITSRGYWANIAVSSTSSIATTPQFGAVGIGVAKSDSYVLNVVGDTYLRGTELVYGAITSQYDSTDLYLQWLHITDVNSHGSRTRLFSVAASGTTKTAGTRTERITLNAASANVTLNGSYDTGSIQSNLTSSTHLNGFKGRAIVNSTAAGTGYNMFIKGNCKSGAMTMGIYNLSWDLLYHTSAGITAGNSYTYSISLLNEKGNTVLRRLYISNGNSSNSANDISETLYVGGTSRFNNSSTWYSNNSSTYYTNTSGGTSTAYYTLSVASNLTITTKGGGSKTAASGTRTWTLERGSGYTYCPSYINTVIGAENTIKPTHVYFTYSSDNWIRKMAWANFRNYIAEDLYWANIKVSSSSSTATEPTFANAYANHGNTSDTFFKATNSSGSVGILTSSNRGLYDYTKSAWIVGTNGTNTWVSLGNFGIGTTTPLQKLHVNGAAQIDGLIYQKSQGITTTIGAQNTYYVHIYNDKTIPFIFNNNVYAINEFISYNGGKNQSVFGNGRIELFHATPYLDFHKNNDAGDYSHRIIDDHSDGLSIYRGGSSSGNNWLYIYSSAHTTLAGIYFAQLSGGLYMSDVNWLRTYKYKPLTINISTNNGYGIGTHRLALDLYGSGHISMLLRNTSNAWGLCSNSDGNFYLGYRGLDSATKTDKDKYVWRINNNGTLYFNNTSTTYISSTYFTGKSATSGLADRATYADAVRDPNYHDTSHRRTSMNNTFADGALHYYLATSSTNTGKPGNDAYILHASWDNGYYEGQLAIPTSHSSSCLWRSLNGGTWGTWKTLADNTNGSTYFTAFTNSTTGWAASTVDLTIGGLKRSVTVNYSSYANNARYGYFLDSATARVMVATGVGWSLNFYRSSASVGSGIKPIYLNTGTLTASSSTVGSGVKPIYMSNGTLTASASSVGGTAKPVYMSSGSITACSATVGSGVKPVYMSAGTITASISTVGESRRLTYLSSGTITAGNYVVSHFGNAGKSNMNDVGKLWASAGMTELKATGRSSDNPYNGSTESTSWHLYWDACYSDNPSGSNAWVAQIINKAGTNYWWVRSRSGGTITNGTAWASGWRHLVTSPTGGAGNSTTPIYVNDKGEVATCTAYSGLLTNHSFYHNGTTHQASVTVGGTTLRTNIEYLSPYSTITYGNNGLLYFNVYTNTTSGAKNVANPIANQWFHHIIMNHGNGAGYYLDIAGHLDSGTPHLYFRQIHAGTMRGWYTILDSTNYKDYLGNLYWANIKVSDTSSTTTSPTFSTAYASNWFRSTGKTGWYSQDYGGGWYMEESTYVRTWGSKAVHTANNNHYAFNSSGGFYSSWNNSYSLSDANTLKVSYGTFNKNNVSVNLNTVLPIVTWSNQVTSYGYATLYSISSVRPTNDVWGRMRLAVGNKDDGTRIGAYLDIDGDGYIDARAKFGVNGRNTSYNFYVNGTSYLAGAVNFSNRLTVNANGEVYPYSTNTRRAGMYGVYDSTKIGHIWSMGTSYRIPDDGANFGNLYGLAYKHTNNGTGGTMAGGHLVVWCDNGSPRAALGYNGVWAAGGFYKKDSSDNYVLLGGGGHKYKHLTWTWIGIHDTKRGSVPSGWVSITHNRYRTVSKTLQASDYGDPDMYILDGNLWEDDGPYPGYRIYLNGISIGGPSNTRIIWIKWLLNSNENWGDYCLVYFYVNNFHVGDFRSNGGWGDTYRALVAIYSNGASWIGF